MGKAETELFGDSVDQPVRDLVLLRCHPLFKVLIPGTVSSVTKMKKLFILYKSVAITFHKSSLLDPLCYPLSPKNIVIPMIMYGAK